MAGLFVEFSTLFPTSPLDVDGQLHTTQLALVGILS
jgi:hypothetical protein